MNTAADAVHRAQLARARLDNDEAQAEARAQEALDGVSAAWFQMRAICREETSRRRREHEDEVAARRQRLMSQVETHLEHHRQHRGAEAMVERLRTETLEDRARDERHDLDDRLSRPQGTG